MLHSSEQPWIIESRSTEESRCLVVIAYLAFENFVQELDLELKNKKTIHDRLFVCDAPASPPPLWAQHTWHECEFIEISSIGDAVKALKARGKWWSPYSFTQHRRVDLIQDQLPKFKMPPLKFLGKTPHLPMGAWTLLDKNLLLVSAKTSSPFPLGNILFDEDKTTPPSRAYLKLWELLTVYNVRPKKGERCMDLGSCPGGWTWVLQQSGAKVLSVDKAPLAAQIAKLPNIEYLKKDAFLLKPEDVGPVDWLFSDIICYPDRLYELVQLWRASGLCKNFVCTIKFQGETDWDTLAKFAAIPGSHLVHLIYNKHEVTWYCVGE